MNYFQAFPKILSPDNSGNQILLTNLLTRVDIIPKLLNNPLVFYSYDIQDGDTPEIVAHKYYGSVTKFWIVLYANQILDPQWGWPISSQNFEIFINDKYGSVSNAYSIIDHYELTSTTLDSISNETSTSVVIIDQTQYLNTSTGTTTYTLPSGATVTQTIAVAPVYAYDYELRLNESKRNIKILDVNYAGTIEAQFLDLLS